VLLREIRVDKRSVVPRSKLMLMRGARRHRSRHLNLAPVIPALARDPGSATLGLFYEPPGHLERSLIWNKMTPSKASSR
jgi:hypothetical protein